MKKYNDQTFTTGWRLPLVGAALLALSACGGGDGEPGNPGDPGGEPAMDIQSLKVEFMDIGLTDGVATVKYRVTNQDDKVVVGIPSATFIAAQLVPEGFTGAGNASTWQHFTAETCASTCPGTYTDLKTGIYTYSFSAPLDGMNGQTLQPGATQRLVIKLGGDKLADGTALPITNAHKDWQSGGEPAYSRDIVAIDTCNSCHNNLAFHGGKYNQVETCVTCHNSSKVSNPANVFAPMVHGKHLTGFPKPISDCETCHKADDKLADNQNWHTVPTMEACGSCHTAINFPVGEGHPAQPNNANCVACHNPDWTANVHSGGDNEAVLASVKADIVSASLSGTTVNVGVKLSNPQTGEVYGSADTLAFISDLRVYANWGGSMDYTTRSARSIRLQSTAPESGADGVYTYAISGLTIPAGTEADTGTLALQGRLCALDGKLTACAEGIETVVMKSSHSFFNATALTATGRRTVVTNDTCGSCHGIQQLNFHGARNDLEGQCQVCHNHNMQADATAANPAHTTADFKQLIHALHRGKFAGFETLNYPGDIGNCAQCHAKGDNGVLTVALPLSSAVQPMALNDGSFTSPTAAVCSSCHESDSAKNHMTQQGGVFAGSKADASAGTESCATCHGQGGFVDVLKVHPIK
ncbi:OmcA/MtrC family decaheme c-type cytochrome [Shewanella sp. JM162201]|uniref:OmcA/MtrC family decaheme c-type cytochrome n=1 Tax=Shewanella jiangmenensis TaxID=2837387 RepID=A0ABS5UYQ4_9GAMM|nr:OmcA/MtrC family decaheme c-type cytochrome [Shewanella jiangmenensis]MBT1443215.1 OmcA/MtrC family decaheme c-type cytochrome [Shewanella jiangmenensis]